MAAFALYAYLADALDESGEPKIADSWWMAFVLWIGIAVMIGGPLLLMSRWPGPIARAVSGLACLAAGSLAAAFALYAYLGAALDETGDPQIADAWWMAFVLWGGVVVLIGGPLLFWIVIPTMRWLRSRGRSNG